MLSVSVLGCGAIGGVVARALQAGEVPGVVLAGVAHRDPVDPPDLPVIDEAALLVSSDLVVECAGHAALSGTGPSVVAAGLDLFVTSVGALADADLLRTLSAGPGRVQLTTGAIGGLDLIRSAAAMGGLRRVRITTTKRPEILGQKWMTDTELSRLGSATEPLVLREGSAREIATAFPRSANVAASVALAAGDWEVVEAAVVADPGAERTTHVIEAEGNAGRYRFEIENLPSEQTPTTSAVVPYAVLRAIGELAGRSPVFR
ncbi:aspartate dehydrogenase domain-containing protein [Amycolatopsis sp. NPDC005232]|uniref:aspartate dehydrogenase domain-containing protein n=1 Tax=Amycolatopsis sp. NPDC005232 TaxID=3157027 RepID=UPI0033AFCFE5